MTGTFMVMQTPTGPLMYVIENQQLGMSSPTPQVPYRGAVKKQTTTALSTVEEEYVAYSEATREATWLVQLSRELNRRINARL